MTEEQEKDEYTILEEQEINYTEKDEYTILEEFALNLIENIKDLDPEFQETIDEHFWELI